MRLRFGFRRRFRLRCRFRFRFGFRFGFGFRLGDELAVQHHVIVRHGKGHGLLVDAVAAFGDGLAVQAENLGVGSDGHFLRRGIAGHDVGLPIRRHTVDFLDLGIGGGRIPGDGVETCYLVQTCVAVEYAAVHGAAVVAHTAREGAARDRSVGVVFHCPFKGAVFDHAVVLDRVLERAILNAARSHIVDLAVEGSAQNAAVVEHFAVELAARDGRRLAHKDVALHRQTISDGAEIVQPAGLAAARQKQHVAIGRVIFNVLPAVTLAGVFAAVGILRITIHHDEVGAGDCSVQHHVIVRHGKGHGRLVAAVAAFGDGLAVQAEDLGVGGDGHFLRRGIAGHDVGGPIRRHTVDFLDLGIGGHGDVVATCYPGQVRIAVEHAASDDAVVFHLVREGAVIDGAVVFHTAHVLEGAVLYGFVVYHPAHVLEGAVLYGAVVCHTAHVLEGALLDGAVVCHCSFKGSSRDYSSGVVCHFFLKGAAGNCRRRLNRTLHRLCGAEIILSTRQSQCLGDVIVTPAGATARDFALVGSLRPALLHDEVGAGDCSVQHHGLARHGEGHGVLVAVDVVALAEEPAVQAENFGAGGDGHGGVFVRVEVPCRAGRSIRVPRAFVVHCAHTAIRYGDVVGIGQPRLAVEHAAGHAASGHAGHLNQARREGAAGDGAADLIEHYVPEHAVLDGAAFVLDSAGHGFEGAGLFRWGRILEVVGPLLQNQGSSVEDIPSVTLADFVSIVGLVVHMLQIHRAVCIHQQAGTERLIVCRQGQLAAGDIGHHERERPFAGQVHCATVIVPKFDAFRRDGPAHKVLGLILRGHFHLAADEHTTAAFGRLAAFDFAAHNFQFSRAVQHHGLARHGEGHGLLVGCIGVAAFVDGLAVQAVDVGAGGDGHGGACADVGGPIRRHTVDSHDLGIGVGIGVGIIPFDGVASYVGRVCLEVEHAAGHGAGSVVHTAREGSARDRSAGVVCHIALEGSVRDCSVGVVYHFFLKGAARNRSSVVYHFSLKGAVASDDAVAYHCSIEGAVRDCSAGAVQLSVVHLSVVHCCIEGTVGNCHTRLNLNRARHRRCGRCSWGLALGMGGAEIKRSSRQSQCAVTVLPAVANGADRVAVLHDEFAGAEHHVPARHGEFHGRPVVWFGVAAGVGAPVDGVAVQAIDFGAGGDGHFLRRGRGRFSHDDVGVPLRRHTVDFLDLGFGGGCIPSDVVATCYVG